MSLNPFARFTKPIFETTEVYPDLKPVCRAVIDGNWQAVEAYFTQPSAGTDPSAAVEAISEIADSETFLQQMVDIHRTSVLARTLLGARLISVGWAIRTRQYAQYVSTEQGRTFHDYLRRADEQLALATADDPGNVAAWTARVKTARGLNVDLDEARRRYDMAATGLANPLFAQRQLLQNLCPKWGGTFEQVHAFARECLETAPAGAPNGSMVAEAHFEHVMATDEDSAVYLRRPSVHRELLEAEARSVLHPAFRQVHGWVRARSVFAAIWCLAGEHGRGWVHFAALGRKASEYPWEMMNEPTRMITVARKAAKLNYRVSS